MSGLSSLKPSKRQRVYDLVQDTGVDVSDWSNMKGGERKAAANPKYCYEWSFIQPSDVIVVNFWYEEIQEQQGLI